MNEGDPVDDLNVPWPNGYFGDIFDVIVTSPTRTDCLSAYPAVFCVGDTRLDAKWSNALRKYVQDGGTLVINAEQVAPGMDEEFLGGKLSGTTKEATVILAGDEKQKIVESLFPYALLTPSTGKPVAVTDAGDPIALVNEVGKGRVILTTPSYLMGHDAAPLAYMARLLLQVTSGLLPVQVRGNVEYSVNLHPRGYVITLSNNEGIVKSSHAAAKMDPKRTSHVVLSLGEKPLKTEDWLGDPRDWSYPDEWLKEYTQPVSLQWKQQGEAYLANVTLRAGEMRVFLVQTR